MLPPSPMNKWHAIRNCGEDFCLKSAMQTAEKGPSEDTGLCILTESENQGARGWMFSGLHLCSCWGESVFFPLPHYELALHFLINFSSLYKQMAVSFHGLSAKEHWLRHPFFCVNPIFHIFICINTLGYVFYYCESIYNFIWYFSNKLKYYHPLNDT